MVWVDEIVLLCVQTPKVLRTLSTWNSVLTRFVSPPSQRRQPPTLTKLLKGGKFNSAIASAEDDEFLDVDNDKETERLEGKRQKTQDDGDPEADDVIRFGEVL